MTENVDPAAIINFFGHIHKDIKAIDTQIASVDSNAKFGNKSREVEVALGQTLKSLEKINPQPVMHPPQIHTFGDPNHQHVPMAVQSPAAPLQSPAQQKDPAQLEFDLDLKSPKVLDNIYNLLYDIKKILTDIRTTLNKKDSNEQPNANSRKR